MRSNGGILLAALLAVAPALNIISTDTAGNIRGVNNTGNPAAANSYVVTYLTGHGAFGGLMLSFAGLIDDGAARPAAAGTLCLSTFRADEPPDLDGSRDSRRHQLRASA